MLPVLLSAASAEALAAGRSGDKWGPVPTIGDRLTGEGRSDHRQGAADASPGSGYRPVNEALLAAGCQVVAANKSVWYWICLLDNSHQRGGPHGLPRHPYKMLAPRR